jgi:membrane protein DedA with SNARE-associated domain
MSLDSALHLLSVYGYLILFPLAVVEGPIITVIAGLLVTTGVFNPFIAYAVVVAGDIVGDSIIYTLGRFGGGHVTRLVERWFGVTQEKLEWVEKRMKKHHFKMMALSKLAQGVGVAGLFAAGVLRISYPLFVLACLLVTLCQVALYLGIGILFGRAYEAIGTYFSYAAEGTVVVALVALALFLWYRHHKKKI